MTIASNFPDQNPSRPRIDWVDYAKGVSIVLVVTMHSTLGVEHALGREGLVHQIVDFARPFRIPAFFLIAGLFLARSIDAPWRAYLSSKVVHFAYLYVLWLAINVALKSASGGPAAVVGAFAHGLVQPFGTLWFIYLLPIFFVATKLLRRWPVALWCGAAALSMIGLDTSWTTIDEFAGRYVFFVSGFLFASAAFNLADWSTRNSANAGACLALWALASAALLALAPQVYLMHVPLFSLALGFAGAAAVVIAAALMAKGKAFEALHYCGRNSLVIYLAFSISMAASRIAITRVYPEIDPTVASLIVTIAAIAGPLLFHRLIQGLPLSWLFTLPPLPALRMR